MFRRSDRRDDGPDERSLAARDAATQGFLALDREQQAAAAAVHAADQLGTGQRLAGAWAQVASVGDAATEAYLTAARDFPLDGTGPVRGAREADERALTEIDRARETIRRFRSTHSRILDEAEFALIVSDDFQGRGLGSELLRRILQVGRDERVAVVRGEILPENIEMLRVSEKVGFRTTRDLEEGVVRAEMTL